MGGWSNPCSKKELLIRDKGVKIDIKMLCRFLSQQTFIRFLQGQLKNCNLNVQSEGGRFNNFFNNFPLLLSTQFPFGTISTHLKFEQFKLLVSDKEESVHCT